MGSKITNAFVQAKYQIKTVYPVTVIPFFMMQRPLPHESYKLY